MPTAFDVQQVRRAFDLIYRNPPVDGEDAWLLGSGGFGATVWNPADAIRIQLGHTELLDGGPGSDAEAEHALVCLRHAASIGLIYPDLAPFDARHLYEYDGRLSVETGVLTVEGRSTSGRFRLRAYVNASPNVLVVEYDDTLANPFERKITFRRVGTRTLDTGNRESGNPEQSLGRSSWEQTAPNRFALRYLTGAVASAAVLDIGHCSAEITVRPELDPHGVRLDIEPSASVSIRLAVALGICGYGEIGKPVSAWKDTSDAAMEAAGDQAVSNVERTVQVPGAQLYDSHREAKTNEWDDSFVHLPDDEHYTQLYWLARYHIKSSYGGSLLPFFINGPWGWMEDVRMWPGCWFHWNFHGAALSLAHIGEAAALIGPYAMWRQRQLPSARDYAGRVFGCSGAAFQDLQLPHGKCDSWEGERHVRFLAAGAQAALHLYDAWRVTRDGRFLREFVHPYLKEVVAFWSDHLEEDPSGMLHSPASVPYEYHGDDTFRDCLTDLAHLRVLFPAYARAARDVGEYDDLARWAATAAARLAPFVVVDLPVKLVTDIREDGTRVFNNPFFAGEVARPVEPVYAIGLRSGDGVWLDHVSSYFDGRSRYGVLCSAQTAHVYPACLVCSDASPEWADRTASGQARRDEWHMAVNALRTIRRFPADETLGDKAGVAESAIAWTGHSLELPAFARLGLPEPLERALEFYVDRYQMYKQGMWNYHPRKKWRLGAARPTFPDGETGHIDCDPWLMHYAFEPQGIFCEALAMMLCDSADEVIRLFQAYRKDATFSLPARGGFRVTAQQQAGRITCVEITSYAGEECAIRIPWDSAMLHRDGDGDGGETELTPNASVVRFATEPNATYRLHEPGTAGVFAPLEAAQPAPRVKGSSVLGIPRRF